MTLEATNGADPRITQGLQPFVALVASTKGGGTVSSSGVIKSMRLDVAHSAIQKALGPMLNAVEHLAIPFPDAAVGVGARWEVREALEVGGLTIFRPTVFQKTEYEVVSIDGATVSLRVKTEQKGPPQPLNDPLLPVANQGVVFGADNRLQSMSGSGHGHRGRSTGFSGARQRAPIHGIHGDDDADQRSPPGVGHRCVEDH